MTSKNAITAEFFILIFLFGLGALGNLKTANAQTFSGPTANAMGGAGRAAGGPEGPLLNPAALVHVGGYRLDGFYRFDDKEQAGTQNDWAFSVSDGTEDNLFQAGLLYVATDKQISGSHDRVENIFVNMGGWVVEGLSLGLQVSRFYEKNSSNTETTVYQSSLGLIWLPNESFGFAAVAYNVLDEHRPDLRPEMALGAHYIYEELVRARLDVLMPTKFNPDKKGVLMTGFETVMAYGLRFRLGGRVDDVAKKSYWTTGIGWEGPKLQLAYAFEKDIRTKESIRQSFDLGVQF